MIEYFKIGKLVAAFGLKGELILKHTLGKKTSLKGLPAIFIEEKKNSFLPWFIEGAKIKSNEEIYLTLEGVNTRESSMKLVQKEIWIPEPDFKKFAAKTSPINPSGNSIIICFFLWSIFFRKLSFTGINTSLFFNSIRQSN